MSVTIPTATVLAERYAVALEQVAFASPDGDVVHVDAHTPGIEAALARTHGISLHELYLYLGYLGREMLPSTAQDQLGVHGAIWGVPRLQPGASVGTATASGTAGTQIPAGTQLSAGSVTLQVMATVSIVDAGGGTGTVDLQLQSVTTGSAADVAGGTALQPVSPIAGVVSVVLDAGGMAGGTDLEPIEAWRARILTRIQQRPGSGKAADYEAWAIDAGASMAHCIPTYAGAGTVGVVVAMAGGSAPTAAELTAIQSAVSAQAPVTATVVVLPVIPTPVAHTIALLPDTTETRAAAASLLAAAFGTQAAIGVSWYVGDSWAALRSIPGLRAVELASPAANVAMAAAALPVLGPITFQAFS